MTKARFRGEYSHAIDAKGRLIIPAKYREALGEEFMISKGLDGCLCVFTMEEWEIFEEKLNSFSSLNADARDLRRFFISGSEDSRLDKQGRILIPAQLLAYAGITDNAVVAGVGNRLEIWSADRWKEASVFDNINDIAAKMESNGLVL